MLNRSLNPVLVRLAIVAAALALLTLVAPVAFADSSMDYAENGTDPVLTFSATDQDGDPIVWSLGGPDEALFDIDGGVLSFKSPPDYEGPKSKSIGTRADMNVYNVTVQATGGSEEVIVTVTNVDEDGSVSFTGLGRDQPQVGRGLEANLDDPDGSVTDEAWQWARSMDMETWTDIDEATSANRSPAAADEGYYLRATVTYTDIFGSGKSVSAVSGNSVEERTVSNAPPSFADQDDDDNGATAIAGIQVNRSVNENTDVATNIGKPVSASDGDNDTLFYELVDTNDLKDGPEAARFTINGATGQIRVGKKLGADEGPPDQREDEQTNLPVDEDGGALAADNAARNSQYVLRVKATDPSGAFSTVTVVVAVNDINEAPNFVDAPTVLNVVENTTALRIGASGTDALGDPAAYDATDQDADRSLTGTGTPNPTAADNETDAFLALDGADAKYFAITNAGKLTIDADQDNDGDDDYMPNFEDKNSYSIVVVATSGAGDRTRRARLDVTVHVIDAEDAGTVTLSAREPQVGRTVVATLTDPDGGVTLSRWTWATSDKAPSDTCAAYAGAYTNVDPDVSSGAYTPKAADNKKCLRAAATYTDNIEGDGTDDDHLIGEGNEGLQRFDVSERPVQLSKAANTAPVFPDQDLTTQGNQSDTASRSVAENMADVNVGGPIPATDGDQDALLFTLNGDDKASFKTSNSGQIQTKVKLDYETKDTYMVALRATDPSGASDTIMVTITVTDGPDVAVITGSTAVDYDENDTGSVATFSATDQDGDDIVWSLSGTDEGDFTITGGVLAFKEAPNYESPASGSIGTRADMNVYNVTVQATGGTHAVVVTVGNVDEDGSVGFTALGQVQPQAGRSLEATVSDPDKGVTDEVWQWARSTDMQTWTDIDGGTSARRTPVAADEGHYLRASVTYTDLFGSDKTASKVTPNSVEERTVANAAPSFADQDDVPTDQNDLVGTQNVEALRTVHENTPSGNNIGKPVSASDADGDVLVYTLSVNVAIGDTTTLATGLFGISSSTGQLTAKAALNFEGTDPDFSKSYSVTVTATDPSGATGTATVRITLIDVPEPAEFSPAAKAQTTMTMTEVTTATGSVEDLDGDAGTDGNQFTFVAADPDVVDGNVETVAYRLAGADAEFFTLHPENGELAVRGDDTATTPEDEEHRPNYESKSSYSITIVAESGPDDGKFRARLDVTVNVVDAEDPGTVTMSAREPQVGRTVVAILGDPDGGVALTMWAWATGEATDGVGEAPPTCPVQDAPGSWDPVSPAVTSGAYTPDGDDEGHCLRATATYTDNLGTDTATAVAVTDRAVQTSSAANTAPKFPDQDLAAEDDQSDETTREVAENLADENVGGPISAGDDDGDALMYHLGGDDAASFKLTGNNGQIQTKVKLDYETKDTYVVALTAMDPSGAADSIMVTITVLDGPDDAVITPGPAENTAPAFEGDTADRMVYENMPAGTKVGGPVTATDADNQTLIYSLGGDDAMYFAIGETSGQITTTMALNHEAMSSLMVTVTASDGEDTDNIDVTVTVEDKYPGCTVAGNSGLTNDCEVLLGGMDTLRGEGNLDWSDDTSIMDWSGVEVSGDPMRVTEIRLSNNGDLDGTIPASLGYLGELVNLYLNGNALSGMIPGSLGMLTKLEDLRLHNNELQGLEMGLGGASSLTRFWAHRNHLSGSIPADLGDLDSLEWLRLDSPLEGGGLTGGIPAELAGMASIERLYLHRNMLSGSIPAELGMSTTLTHITLQQNDLTGGIPDLSGMSSLVWLGLYDNALSGSIPATLSMLSNLERLYLHGNMLTGAVPTGIGDLAALTNLWLKNNDLSGVLPGSLGNLGNLERVRISGNAFTGCVPAALTASDSTSSDADMLGLATCGDGS